MRFMAGYRAADLMQTGRAMRAHIEVLTGCKIEGDRPQFVRREHVRAGSRVRVARPAECRRAPPPLITTHSGVLHAAKPGGSLRRLPWCGASKHIAVVRLFGHHVLDARRFQVARQQHPPAGVLDGQRDAVRVVAAENAALAAGAARRSETSDADLQPVAGPDFANRHARAVDGVAKHLGASRGARVTDVRKHDGRNIHSSNSEAFQEAGHPV